jgi:hypothetical protein
VARTLRECIGSQRLVTDILHRYRYQRGSKQVDPVMLRELSEELGYKKEQLAELLGREPHDALAAGEGQGRPCRRGGAPRRQDGGAGGRRMIRKLDHLVITHRGHGGVPGFL